MTSAIPTPLSQDEQLQSLIDYLPGGKLFAAANVVDTQFRGLLTAFTEELLRTDSLIDIFRIDTVPDETENFINDWERALSIPDDCFNGKGTDDERRLAIVVKLAALGIQTDPDFVELAATFGVEVTVESGSIHGAFPFVFPMKFYPSARAARFTLVVRPTEDIGDTFTYTFPIIFGSEALGTVECLFNRVKPANVEIVFENQL